MQPVTTANAPTENGVADWLWAKVVESVDLSADTRLLRLASDRAEPLPPAEPGAHIAIRCGEDCIRHYSLTGSRNQPGIYELGVKLARDGLGGSRWIFEHLAVGSRVRISAPRNHFPLKVGQERLLFLSGGIGITPIVPMLYALRERGVRSRLVHLCRSPADLGFHEWIRELASFHDVHVHFDSENVGLYDLEAEIDHSGKDAAIYCCGPSSMLDAVRAHCERTGREQALHFEYFSAPAAAPAAPQESEFVVIQHSTGRRIPVAATKTMLAALREAGIEMQSECEYGVCGWCAVGVLDGTPAHFDSYLTTAEKEANKMVLPCVSRCSSATIRLDI